MTRTDLSIECTYHHIKIRKLIRRNFNLIVVRVPSVFADLCQTSIILVIIRIKLLTNNTC